MNEVTEGELVMWSVDPGPHASTHERQLWRMATAARSYLCRMRAAELAHRVVADERDAVTVERDEAREALGVDLKAAKSAQAEAQSSLGDLMDALQVPPQVSVVRWAKALVGENQDMAQQLARHKARLRALGLSE